MGVHSVGRILVPGSNDRRLPATWRRLAEPGSRIPPALQCEHSSPLGPATITIASMGKSTHTGLRVAGRTRVSPKKEQRKKAPHANGALLAHASYSCCSKCQPGRRTRSLRTSWTRRGKGTRERAHKEHGNVLISVSTSTYGIRHVVRTGPERRTKKNAAGVRKRKVFPSDLHPKTRLASTAVEGRGRVST